MSAAVQTDDAEYLAAIAELPLSAHRSLSRDGAIVVVGRAGRWADRVREAIDAGARALVLREPRVDRAGLDRILEATIPVVIERPLLRSDLVDDVLRGGTRAPALVQIECSATTADLPLVIRDALGWARVLSGGPLELRAAGATPRGITALLERRGDGGEPVVPISLLATRRPGSSAWIRVTAIGAERTEVTIDSGRRSAIVERTTEAGRAVHPTRWESGERVVLRRAIEALESGSTPADLADFARDSALVDLLEHAGVAE